MSATRIALHTLRSPFPGYSPATRQIFARTSSQPRPTRSIRIPQNSLSCALQPTRLYSSKAQAAPEPQRDLTDGERKVFDKLKEELEPTKLDVQDISGGCGSMYGVDIVSPKFQGLTVVKQHKLVNQILAEDIKGWHGMQLKTKAA